MRYLNIINYNFPPTTCNNGRSSPFKVIKSRYFVRQRSIHHPRLTKKITSSREIILHHGPFAQGTPCACVTSSIWSWLSWSEPSPGLPSSSSLGEVAMWMEWFT